MRLIALLRQMSHRSRHTHDSSVGVNYNNLCTKNYHSLPRSDCGSWKIANMATMTNADDNDKNSVLFVSNGMYRVVQKKLHKLCHAITFEPFVLGLQCLHQNAQQKLLLTQP